MGTTSRRKFFGRLMGAAAAVAVAPVVVEAALPDEQPLAIMPIRDVSLADFEAEFRRPSWTDREERILAENRERFDLAFAATRERNRLAALQAHEDYVAMLMTPGDRLRERDTYETRDGVFFVMENGDLGAFPWRPRVTKP